MKKTTKARVNLTVDPDIYREARRVFDTMDLNMSAFLEIQLSMFLQTVQPLMPLLEKAEQGDGNLTDVKAAMRIWFAHSVGQPVAEAYQIASADVLTSPNPTKRTEPD